MDPKVVPYRHVVAGPRRVLETINPTAGQTTFSFDDIAYLSCNRSCSTAALADTFADSTNNIKRRREHWGSMSLNRPQARMLRNLAT